MPAIHTVRRRGAFRHPEQDASQIPIPCIVAKSAHRNQHPSKEGRGCVRRAGLPQGRACHCNPQHPNVCAGQTPTRAASRTTTVRHAVQRRSHSWAAAAAAPSPRAAAADRSHNRAVITCSLSLSSTRAPRARRPRPGRSSSAVLPSPPALSNTSALPRQRSVQKCAAHAGAGIQIHRPHCTLPAGRPPGGH